jgi:ABC-type Mn2+/Zn2+ transport system ATPase subunit
MSAARIIAETLVIGYPGRRVSGPLDFEWRGGGVHFILGRNGSGKTTLARTLLGLAPPLAGRVQLDPEGARAYVPQEESELDDSPVSVGEAVEMGLWGRDARGRPHPGGRPGGVSQRERRVRVDRALAAVGLEERRGERFARLSRGQRTRVRIARALIGEARLVVLDEPTAGLDDESRAALWPRLVELAADPERVVFVITHDLPGFDVAAASVLRLEDGSTREAESPPGYGIPASDPPRRGGGER